MPSRRIAALEMRIAALRAGLGRATFAEWRALCEVLFPRAGIRLFASGEIQLHGAIALDESGEAALVQAARKLQPSLEAGHPERGAARGGAK